MIYAYARLSRVTERSVSIEEQIAKICAYANLHDLTLDGGTFIDDGVSGKTLDERPSMMKMLRAAKRGDTIIVMKLDRLTRSLKDLITLVESGVALVSVYEQIDTNSASGRMIVKMFGLLAEWERETIAERTTAALAGKRERKQVYGQTPYGWRREGFQLVESQTEQMALKVIAAQREKGASYGEIVNELNARMLPSKSGKPWKKHMVQSILETKMNAELFSPEH